VALRRMRDGGMRMVRRHTDETGLCLALYVVDDFVCRCMVKK